VKLMGRHAGFIAAGATVANEDVNFTLIPEVPFKLDGPNGFLSALKERLKKRAHAVVVVAEGAGQELFQNAATEKDASGNIKLKDIGLLLRERIEAYFKEANIPIVMRYFDPSYLIRSSAANAADSLYVICMRAMPCTPRWLAKPAWLSDFCMTHLSISLSRCWCFRKSKSTRMASGGRPFWP
jgi:6-phosphofructokinase